MDFVYFLGSDAATTKIGTTGDIVQRVTAIISAHRHSPFGAGVRLFLRGYVLGTRTDEQRYHAWLRAHHHTGEWFDENAVEGMIATLGLRVIVPGCAEDVQLVRATRKRRLRHWPSHSQQVAAARLRWQRHWETVEYLGSSIVNISPNAPNPLGVDRG